MTALLSHLAVVAGLLVLLAVLDPLVYRLLRLPLGCAAGVLLYLGVSLWAAERIAAGHYGIVAAVAGGLLGWLWLRRRRRSTAIVRVLQEQN